jgi:hypothetical protein
VPLWFRSFLLLAVVLLACLLFFVRLRAPLLEPQEARYAEIPRQMLDEGRLVVPVLHEQDYLDKPPLLYWCVMASYRVFGVHDWAARLVPGLAGVLTVLLTYLWGRRAFGTRTGFCAAVVLTLMPEFVYRDAWSDHRRSVRRRRVIGWHGRQGDRRMGGVMVHDRRIGGVMVHGRLTGLTQSSGQQQAGECDPSHGEILLGVEGTLLIVSTDSEMETQSAYSRTSKD